MITKLKSWVADVPKWLHRNRSQVLVLALGAAIGASLVALSSGSAPETDHQEPTPTHASQDSSPISHESSDTAWTCSMHTHIRQPEAGPCPICGMDMIPVKSHDDGNTERSNRVVLSERARALAALETTSVQRQDTTAAELRLLGQFEPNETTLKAVTAWTGGRIDRLDVNVTGERVRAGQVVATLYSPEIFAAHQDLLVAKRQLTQMHASPELSTKAASAALEAVRERLRLLGLPSETLERMEKQDAPTRAVAVRSPFSGSVIERMVVEGSYVSTGTPLYRIADLGSLWLQLDAYENDLSRLSVGQSVRVEVPALPDEEFEGRVTFIEPTLDPRRRTAKVRVHVNNRKGQLRPGMFAEATVNAPRANGRSSPLVVPKSAPLFTGRRAVVYVEVQNEDSVAYEARTVRLGPLFGDVYGVVAGLAEGDRVVTRGAFTLDAELQIRGGEGMMASADDREEGIWDAVIPISADERRRLSPVVSLYLDVQLALADDSLPAANASAQELLSALDQIDFGRSQQAHTAWMEISSPLRDHAEHIALAENLDQARHGFELLSRTVLELLSRLGNPLDQTLRLASCAAATESEGAVWIQAGSEMNHSYLGASSSGCGEVGQEIPPDGYLGLDTQSPTRQRPVIHAGGHHH